MSSMLFSNNFVPYKHAPLASFVKPSFLTMTHFLLFFTILILTGTTHFRPTTATADQLSCTMCDECDNPCQPPPSPPPPSPSSDDNCPPPPSPPTSGVNPPPSTPSVPNFPYYPPPPPFSGGGGGYGYPTPPPPNPILPYFPFYYYNPPPSGQSSVSGRLKFDRIQVIMSYLFLLFFV